MSLSDAIFARLLRRSGLENAAIEELLRRITAGDLPVPGAGDVGKVPTVNAGHTGYELDVPAGGSAALSGIYDITTTAAPNSAWTQLALSASAGDAILDLTDPENPIARVAGLYTVNASIKHHGNDATHNLFCEVDLDSNGEDGYSLGAVPMVDDGDGTVHVTCTYYVPVGGVITIACQQISGASVNLNVSQSKILVSVVTGNRGTIPN